MRLNRLLALRLGVSRRAADKLIASGQVSVNDRTATVGLDTRDNDKVLVNQTPLPESSGYLYLLLNKPIGYVCSRNGQGARTIYELLPDIYQNLKAVGRLDKDSSGLLLLTNDGQLHNKLIHPSFEKEKVYQVTLNKKLNPVHQKMIESGGLTLKDGLSKFKITTVGQRLEVRLHEGRNRQIRRTFMALDYKVKKLQRNQFGSYKLDGLPVGQFKLVDKSV
jgi:pseudouridine synthase